MKPVHCEYCHKDLPDPNGHLKTCNGLWADYTFLRETKQACIAQGGACKKKER